MTDVFGPDYSSFYDAAYADKDYSGECDLIEELFRAHARDSVRNVLDLGAGTGNHALPLARRGYEVTAVDRSKEMLEIGRQKSRGVAGLEWKEADLRSLDFGRTFDAVLMLFAVLGYQITNQDVAASLRSARSHLSEGGLFICDVWYGPAVLTIGPSPRFKVFASDDATFLRASEGTLDERRHVCRVEIETWRLRGDRLDGHSREAHDMRFFFPLELEQFFTAAGFEMVRLMDFEEPDTDPGPSTWNALVVARAVG